MFAILALCAVILLTIYLFKYDSNKPKNFPPGPPRLPLWGSYWFLLKENYTHAHLALEALAKKYKTDILGLYLGNEPTVVTFNTELCKELLVREEFMGRNDTIIARSRGLGEIRGLFFLDGPPWKEERRFTLRHLRDFGFGRRSEVMENFVVDEVKYLISKFADENATPDFDICRGKGHFLIPDLFYGPLLNCIFLVLCSTRFDNNRLREIGRNGMKFQRSADSTGCAITMTPWLRFIAPDFFGFTTALETNNHMLDFVREMVDEHLKTISMDHSRDLIDDYIIQKTKDGAELDYKQLLLVVLDCTSPVATAIGQTLSFYFAYLINNPDIQVKIQNEISAITGNSRMPSLDDRKNMPYLEASIREVLRIYPLNPFGIPRRCVKDTTLGGYFVPKDTIMMPSLWSAHRDPRVWPEPDKFMPERFLDKNGQLLKKDLSIAFGAGKRSCAGETFSRQNMFLIIAGLLQQFTFKSPTGKPVEFDIVPGVNISLRENWVIAVPN